MVGRDVKLRERNLIFEEGGVLDGIEATYENKKMGYMTSMGILCSCCRKIFSPSKFEDHAGMGARKRPYHYILLENWISLDEVSKYLSKMHDAQDNGKCGADDEQQMLCDKCRSYFYADSASSALNPSSNWRCRLCKGEYRQSSDSDLTRRAGGLHPVDQIPKFETSVASNQEEVDPCFLCSRSSHDCDSQLGQWTLLACHQCEKEYHMCCLNRDRIPDLKVKPMGKWFCCPDCEGISSYLQTMIESQPKEFTDSCSERKRKKPDDTDKTVRWRLLLCAETTRKDIQRPDLEKLAEAYAILKDSLPVDTVSKRDLVRDLFFRKKELHSVYCAVVTVGSSVVAAGLIRVLGREIAELPLAATAEGSRSQGYFRQLISGIEKVLKGCRVHRFVLPATKLAKPMWKHKFGFTTMSKEQEDYYLKNCWNMLHFPDTKMLQKAIDVNFEAPSILVSIQASQNIS